MTPTPLHRLAEAQRAGLQERLEAAPNPVEEVARKVQTQARLSVNMKPSILRAVLKGERHLNMFEYAEREARETGRGVDEILRDRLGDWYTRRIAFEVEMGGGRNFHYHCLNVGGLGAQRFGRLCVIDRRDPSDRPPEPVWIAWDSLGHEEFWDGADGLDQRALAEWVAPCDEPGALAALKLAETPAGTGPLPERICNNEDFIEGLCLEGLSHSEVGEIRSDEKFSDDHLQERALRIALYGASMDEKLDLMAAQETRALAKDLGIRWNVVQS